MLKNDENSVDYLAIIEQDMEEYPPTLQAKHIAEYLGVGTGVAYKLLKSGALPAVTVPDSKFILVPKQLFIKWYAERLSEPLDEEAEKVV